MNRWYHISGQPPFPRLQILRFGSRASEFHSRPAQDDFRRNGCHWSPQFRGRDTYLQAVSLILCEIRLPGCFYGRYTLYSELQYLNRASTRLSLLLLRAFSISWISSSLNLYLEAIFYHPDIPYHIFVYFWMILLKAARDIAKSSSISRIWFPIGNPPKVAIYHSSIP